MEAILLILSKHCLRSKAVLNLKLWNSLLDWASLKLTARQVFCILNSVPLHFEKVPVFSGLTCKLPWRSLNILLPSKSSVSFKTAQRKQSKPSPLYLHLKKKKKSVCSATVYRRSCIAGTMLGFVGIIKIGETMTLALNFWELKVFINVRQVMSINQKLPHTVSRLNTSLDAGGFKRRKKSDLFCLSKSLSSVREIKLTHRSGYILC